MNTYKRRDEILRILRESNTPMSGTELAKLFSVSRQVIVQDIAVIRAQGQNILATSKGYITPEVDLRPKTEVSIVCKHEGYDQMEEELKILIDAGAKVIDVIIRHPIYGEIRSSLMIQSRMDIEEFMDKIRKKQAEPLASLTRGEHIHTLEFANDKTYRKIIDELSKKGFLVRGDKE
ncbi:MAG: transcription repressor NadR [Alkaliphilus sp.]|nr:transcription repressor NadR [Alkaliphilus sp.]MBS3995099.1 transcription repressor NadR [Alkaliphilus sp.]